MRTDPKSEKEIQELSLMPEGIYPFTVVDAQDTVSKSGNEMIKLQLSVYDQQNRAHKLFDYLLASMAFKLRHFCEHTGLIDKYDADCLQASDCVQRSGFVQIVVDKPQQKPDGTFYAPKNSVKDYCADGSAGVVNPAKQSADAPFHDDVPW